MLDKSEIAPESVRRLSRAEYEKLVEIGMFQDERVELLHGVVIAMTPAHPAHGGAVQQLNRLLVLALDPRAAVRVQSSFAASDGSEPEPDIAVVPSGRYRDAHPDQAHLIVEVSDSSLNKDRTVKARLYAECGVPEYWIVNLVDALIEVHTDIVRGTYAKVIPYRQGEKIALLRFPDVTIAVDEILG
ncbi:MAG TPA: Uma2 family endonuclease [Kofleriaceae bacterium]|nr:Uma2 family endonuclease [Kofleriaceae bacterium]